MTIPDARPAPTISAEITIARLLARSSHSRLGKRSLTTKPLPAGRRPGASAFVPLRESRLSRFDCNKYIAPATKPIITATVPRSQNVPWIAPQIWAAGVCGKRLVRSKMGRRDQRQRQRQDEHPARRHPVKQRQIEIHGHQRAAASRYHSYALDSGTLAAVAARDARNSASATSPAAANPTANAPRQRPRTPPRTSSKRQRDRITAGKTKRRDSSHRRPPGGEHLAIKPFS